MPILIELICFSSNTLLRKCDENAPSIIAIIMSIIEILIILLVDIFVFQAKIIF